MIKNWFYLSFILTVIAIIFISGCGKTLIGHPSMGETRAFPIPAVGNWATMKPYKMSKLREGYGLYVFSYRVKKEKDTLSGVRIWEHRFKEEEIDRIVKVGVIPTGKKPVDYPNAPLGNSVTESAVLGALAGLAANIDAKGFGPEFHMTFQKGCVVYGGRVFIDATVTPYVITIEDYLDDDVGPIKNHFKGTMAGIEILENFMRPVGPKVPEFNDSWEE